ncbi:MAG: tetratricopeptide repeat protein [Candidatus Cloacimonetes bacterium]|nr:tetratricopeptide repeat protein [Candidatus Cloacimonadota bacterium]
MSILKPQEQEKPLLEQLKEERKELAVLEEEISYFYNLLQQRAGVRKLYEKGKISDLKKVFSKHVKVMDRMFEENRLEALSLKIGEQKIVYGDIVELQDQILYYRAKLAFIKKDYKKAQNLLEDLVANYPQSQRLNPGLLILQEIYFREGRDEQLITCFDNYAEDISIKQNYWLAQSYFNVGRYEDALSIFKALSKNKEFGFQAKAMQAMIAYFMDGIDTAIEKFKILEERYGAGTDYYDFVILSLARLYSVNDDIDKALTHYENYSNTHNGKIDDALLYEIALQFYNNQNYNKAINYFNEIVKKPVKSEYFASAKFLVAVSEQGRGNFDQAESTLTEIISRNNILLETMNTKYRLLAKYNETCRELTHLDIPAEEIEALQKKADNIEEALQSTNSTMQELYTGLDPLSLELLQLLEEEYLSYSNTIADIEAIILLANTIPNKRIPAIIDREIASTDSSIVTLQILNYLGHRSRFTYKDYDFARALAIEKVYQDNLLKTWNEIEQIAIANKHEEMLQTIRESRKLVEENLESIDVIAQYMFKGKPSDEFQQIIQEESEAIDKNRENLISLKQEVIENFNKQIAKRLSKEKEILVAEFQSLNLSYDKALAIIMDEVKVENEKYQFSLLGVLFKQTQIIDEEYQEFQEKLRNE